MHTTGEEKAYTIKSVYKYRGKPIKCRLNLNLLFVVDASLGL
jgi:hypothetical protein